MTSTTTPTTPTTDLRYPIGAAKFESDLSEQRRNKLIDEIVATPSRMRAAVKGLSAEQLATPYRPGGWTVIQLAHHVPDSHMNAYIRFKLALTEDCPAIKTYAEDRWAELADSRNTPIETSLCILDCVHERWNHVLRAMTSEDFKRKLNHPDKGVIDLEAMLCLYAWHGNHHVAHITELRKRMGW